MPNFKIQLILQVDNDPAIEAGALILYNKAKKNTANKLWYVLNKDTNLFELRQGNQAVLNNALTDPNPIIDKILVTGHGGVANGEKTIGGFTASQIAMYIEDQLMVNGEYKTTTVGRITLDACEIDNTFAADLYDKLTDQVQPSVKIAKGNIHAYNALVSADSDGHRFTSRLEGNAIVTRYKDKSVKFGGTGHGEMDAFDLEFYGISTGDIKRIDLAPEFQSQVKNNTISQYADKTVFDTFLLNALGTKDCNTFKLTQYYASNQQYLILQPSRDITTTGAYAYFLPALEKQGSTPAWVDIPKVVQDGVMAKKFLFTQALTGGSVIVTQSPDNPDALRVYHDIRTNASVYYSNVLMAVDYEDYRIALGSLGKAAASVFLYYETTGTSGQWKLVNQPLMIGTQSDVSLLNVPAQRSDVAVNTVDSATYKRLDLTAQFKSASDKLSELSQKYKCPPDKMATTLETIIKVISSQANLGQTEREELDEIKEDLSAYDDANFYETIASKMGPNAVVNLSDVALKAMVDANPRLNITSNTHFAFDNLQKNTFLVKKASVAMTDLVENHAEVNESGNQQIPVFQAIEQSDIPLLNESTLEITTVTTDDIADLAEFKQYLNEQMADMVEGDPVDGLNAALSIQTLMAFFMNRRNNPFTNNQAYPPMAKAMEIHGYFNLVQAGYGLLMEGKNVAQLSRSVYSDGIIATEGIVSKISGTLSHVASAGGVLLGAGSVILDGIELSEATTSSQKAVFSTQLTFDAAGTLLGIGGIGAGLAGAATAGAVLSGAGVLLGGLAVGFVGLAQAFGRISDNAEMVGHYLDQAFNSYKTGYYVDNSNKITLLRIGDGAVVSKIDLTKQQIAYSSQMLWQSKHGDTGSGRINYFFWPGDMPEEIPDNSKAINVRQFWNNKNARNTQLPDTANLIAFPKDCPILLPATPRSFIGYDYNLLPGATIKHSDGFDLWRILEEDETFDFDFYIWPGERIIDTLHFYYDTPWSISILLDQNDRQLIVPALPDEMKGTLLYDIVNQGHQCVINLKPGIQLNLSVAENATGAVWVLDGSNMAGNFTILDGNKISIDDVMIQVNNTSVTEVQVIDQKNDLNVVDFASKQLLLKRQNGNDWSVQSLHDYLLKLAKEHKLPGQYVMIQNFTSKDHRAVGNAYYDVALDQFIYTIDQPASLTNSAVLAAVVDNKAYFYSVDNNAFWITDTQTCALTTRFSFLLDNLKPTIKRAWSSANTVSVMQSITPASGAGAVEIVYQLDNDIPTLVAIFGADALIKNLSGSGTLPAGSSLTDLLTQSLSAHNAPVIQTAGTPPTNQAVMGKVISISTDPTQNVPNLWVNIPKNTVIKPNFTKLSDIDFTKMGIALINCWENSMGETVHFFLLNPNPAAATAAPPKPARLIRQVENQPANEITVTGGLLYLMAEKDSLFITTLQGYNLAIDTDGNQFLVALSSIWLKNNPTWWKALPDLRKNLLVTRTNVPIIGLAVNIKGQQCPFPVWYNVVHNRIAIAPVSVYNALQPDNSGSTTDPGLAFLGIAEDLRGSYFFDAQNKVVYWQLLPLYDQIESACANGFDNLDLSAFPDSKQILAGQKISNAYVNENQLDVVLEEGLILRVDFNENCTLLSVQNTWAQQHKTTLLHDLKTLCAAYKQTEPIIVFAGSDAADATPSWYNPALDMLWSPGAAPGQTLAYIGYNQADQTAFFADQKSGEFYSFNNNKLQQLFHFSAAVRYPHALAIIDSIAGNGIAVPTIDDCDELLLGASSGLHVFKINSTAWQHYQYISINSNSAIPGYVVLDFADLKQFSAARYGDDLMILENATSKFFLLKNACVDSAAHVCILDGMGVSIDTSKIVALLNATPSMGSVVFNTCLDALLGRPSLVIQMAANSDYYLVTNGNNQQAELSQASTNTPATGTFNVWRFKDNEQQIAFELVNDAQYFLQNDDNGNIVLDSLNEYKPVRPIFLMHAAPNHQPDCVAFESADRPGLFMGGYQLTGVNSVLVQLMNAGMINTFDDDVSFRVVKPW